ncbi:hypothetical protein N202_07895 [Helicobacter pylori UM067]|nr:hypothetical protein N202_07895 [Helicobacter pylori UM067]
MLLSFEGLSLFFFCLICYLLCFYWFLVDFGLIDFNRLFFRFLNLVFHSCVLVAYCLLMFNVSYCLF